MSTVIVLKCLLYEFFAIRKKVALTRYVLVFNCIARGQELQNYTYVSNDKYDVDRKVV